MSKLPRQFHRSLKSLWVDMAHVSVRSDVPVAGISFFSLIDGKELFEACRVTMTTPQLKALADVICRTTGYYPTAKPTK